MKSLYLGQLSQCLVVGVSHALGSWNPLGLPWALCCWEQHWSHRGTSVSLWGFALTAAIRGHMVFLLLSCTQKHQLLKALIPTSAVYHGAEPRCDPTVLWSVLATQNWEQVKSLSAEKVQQAQCQGSEVQDCPESILRRGERRKRECEISVISFSR